MFPVRVHHWIAVADAIGWACRDFELPFAPFPGLSLHGISRSEDGLAVEVVAWDVNEWRFDVYLERHVDADDTLAEELDFLGPGWHFRAEGGRPRGSSPDGRKT